VGEGSGGVVLGCRYHFPCGQFGGFPVAEFNTVFDDLFLAGCAVAAVLLVGLLEIVESKDRFALV
jgi:hypothetical protein